MADLTPRTPSTSFSSTTRTSCPLDIPPGTVENDLLIALVAIQNATALADETGWNSQELVGATALSWGLYWRWAPASPPASYSIAHASARDAGILLAIPDVDPTTPITLETGTQVGTGNRAFDAIDPTGEHVVFAFLSMTEAAPDQPVVDGTNCDSIVGQESSDSGGGQNVGVAVLQEYLASGGSFTPTYTIATTTLTRSGTISIAVKPAAGGGGAVDLTPADSAHGHATESPTLTQTHVLAPADSGHGHSSESPTLTQLHVLAPADTAHAHTAESPALTQVHVVSPADSAHGHTSESPALTQTHALAPADSAHAHTTESPTLSIDGGSEHNLTPADSLHGHASESPTLTQVHVLPPADSLHSHTTESPALTQVHVLTPADTLHAHAADSPSFTQIDGSAVTPPERTLTIGADDRITTFASDDRTASITDDRTTTIGSESRTAAIT